MGDFSYNVNASLVIMAPPPAYPSQPSPCCACCGRARWGLRGAFAGRGGVRVGCLPVEVGSVWGVWDSGVVGTSLTTLPSLLTGTHPSVSS